MADSILDPGEAEILDLIDKLRSLGVSNYIPLPQLIVCGDQSAGKSSVLQALSQIPFPIREGICTRFPIEVILRRSATESASVRIEPAEDTPSQESERLRGFGGSRPGLDDVFDLIEKATKAMKFGNEGGLREHVLRVEVSGPSKPHLTLVDLPGLIHHVQEDKGQTDKDKHLIKRLVQKYMSFERSIILAVVAAKNQLALQEVLSLVKEADPTGSRTMGIITKPDTLRSGSEDEREFLKLAKNEKHKLKLGWHVVRNAEQGDESKAGYDRDIVEAEFFRREPWNSLPSTDLGIPKLQKKLGRCLCDHICENMTPVFQEMHRGIYNCNQILERLGPCRTSQDEQIKHLSKFADAFSQSIYQAIRENYELPYTREHQLRSLIRACEDRFAVDFQRLARKYAIQNRDVEIREVEMTGSSSQSSPVRDSPYYDLGLPREESEERFITMIETEVLQKNRGRELLGTTNPRLITDVFKIQSEKWEAFVYRYGDLVFQEVYDFVNGLIFQLTDELTGKNLLENRIQRALEEKKGHFRSKFQEIFAPYKSSWASSWNPHLTTKLYDIEEWRTNVQTRWTHNQVNTRRTAATKLMQQAEAYYDVVQYTLIDNLSILGVEHCLLEDLHTLFTASSVRDMSVEELSKIAAEAADTIATRTETLAKKAVIDEALQACQVHTALHPRSKRYLVKPPPSLLPRIEHSEKSGTPRPSTPENQSLNDKMDRLAISGQKPRTSSGQSRASSQTFSSYQDRRNATSEDETSESEVDKKINFDPRRGSMRALGERTSRSPRHPSISNSIRAAA